MKCLTTKIILALYLVCLFITCGWLYASGKADMDSYILTVIATIFVVTFGVTVFQTFKLAIISIWTSSKQ